MSQEYYGRSKILWHLLLAIVLVQCFGLTFHVFMYGSDFLSSLWYTFKVNGNLARSVDQFMIVSFMLSALFAAFLNKAKLWFFVGFWVFFLGANSFFQDDSFAADYTFFSQAIRYCAPMGIGYYMYQKHSDHFRAERGLNLLLALGISMTFIAHGIEAINHNPEFVDFIIRIFRKYFSLNISQSDAESMLRAIGLIDVALGVSLLFESNRQVLLYMAFWGFLTAIVRIFYSPSIPGLESALIRSANGGAPLVLWLFLVRTERLSSPYQIIRQFMARRTLPRIPAESSGAG